MNFSQSNESARNHKSVYCREYSTKSQRRSQCRRLRCIDSLFFDKCYQFYRGTWKYSLIYNLVISAYKTFNISDTESVRVNYLYGLQQFNYRDLDDLNAKALEMEYVNLNYSFLIIILASNLKDLSHLEITLKNYSLAKIYDQMSVRKAEIMRFPDSGCK